MAEESDEIFSNFDPMLAFGLEMSEGKNQKESKSKPTIESNSVKEDGSSKKRRFTVRSKAKILMPVALRRNSEHWR